MNNLVPIEQTTALTVLSKTSTTLYLSHLPQLKRGANWYIQNLEESNSGDIDYSGDYTVHQKVTGLDWHTNTVTVSSTTNFNEGDRVYFYSPFVNYEFTDGQESSPLISSTPDTYMSTYVSVGSSWYDSKK